MKKQFLLLAGSALILASCGSNNETQAPTQAQVDSAVNAKLAEHDAANAAKNDSTLKAIEAEKAAAAAKETKETKTTTTTKNNGKGKTKTTTKTTVVEPAPPPPTTKQDDKFNNRSGNTPGQSKTSAEAEKAQDDKFNRRGK